MDCADKFEEAKAHDLVSFAVVCRPRAALTLDDFHTKLSLETLQDFLPTENVQAEVAQQLRHFGFEVFDKAPSPVVSGRGSVELFQSVFHVDVQKRSREVKKSKSRRIITSIVRRQNSARALPPRDMPALLVAVVHRPMFIDQILPPETGVFELHLPGDIAQLTRSSATHREIHGGSRATGGGVPVAVIDSGFARHPYYRDHAYNVMPLAAPDTSNPEDDVDSHGTAILSTLFACAPDVAAYAIKHGEDAALAIAYALALRPRPRVISLSFSDDLSGFTQLPDELLPLRLAILVAVFFGVIVVAGAGNGQKSFPGVLPEVISVGGVKVDGYDHLTKWPDSSSYTSNIFVGRTVPDLCGIASEMLRPIPPDEPKGPFDWDPGPGGTSSATPQIAGICALLLQKTPSLTPSAVRFALQNKARPIGAGTGSGLVDALRAWNSV